MSFSACARRMQRALPLRRFTYPKTGAFSLLNVLTAQPRARIWAARIFACYDGSYELIAKRIGQFVAPEAQSQALEQLFATVALCCAIENGDAHLKNFAVLYENALSPVRLAPAYDLVSTTVYRARDVMALELGGSKAFPARGRLIAFGRQACALSSARVSSVLQRVEQGASTAQVLIRKYTKQHPDFSNAGKHLTAAIERGLTRSIRR
jgi:serine/threonine-protein kinase HipA